ncbi:MAG: hypothetical protein ACI9QL_004640, partial [Candidatus Omnitrophota bacterium]
DHGTNQDHGIVMPSVFPGHVRGRGWRGGWWRGRAGGQRSSGLGIFFRIVIKGFDRNREDAHPHTSGNERIQSASTSTPATSAAHTLLQHRTQYSFRIKHKRTPFLIG